MLLLHGKSVMSLSCLLLDGSALWPGHRMRLCPILVCRVWSSSLFTLYTLGQMLQYSVFTYDTDIQSEKNFIFLGTAGCVYFSAYLGSSQSSHCLPPLSPDSRRDIDCAMHWAGHAALTLELMSFQTTQRLRTSKMRKPGVLFFL